jgi:aspartate dehydrogenase
MATVKIGIVGCGAIGSSLAGVIRSGFLRKAELSGLFDIDLKKSRALALKLGNRNLAVSDLNVLIRRSGLLIEATKVDSVFEIAKKAILASKDIMLMSVGGALAHYRELSLLVKKSNSRIFIPSGAVCAIDGLKAAGCGKIRKVVLTTRKPVKAFSGIAYLARKKINLGQIKKDTVIFDGNAASAIKAFPQNINVAATLSLAGIGPHKTRVRIVASPHIARNIHELEVESESGRIFSRTENVVHPANPKTSYLAVLSAIATLKQVLEPVKIGT